jgi:hypothetical protein
MSITKHVRRVSEKNYKRPKYDNNYSDLRVLVRPVRLVSNICYQTLTNSSMVPAKLRYKGIYTFVQSTLTVRRNLSCFLNVNVMNWNILEVTWHLSVQMKTEMCVKHPTN